MHIERLRKKDVKAFSRVARSIIRKTPYYSKEGVFFETKEYSDRKVLENMSNKEHLFFVAKEDSVITGFLHGYFDAHTFWINWIGVAAQFRNLGVASRLLKHLEKIIRGKAHKIWFDTRDTNKESIIFFKKRGYKKFAHLKNHWYRGNFFLWEKYL